MGLGQEFQALAGVRAEKDELPEVELAKQKRKQYTKPKSRHIPTPWPGRRADVTAPDAQTPTKNGPSKLKSPRNYNFVYSNGNENEGYYLILGLCRDNGK